ncbi:MAG: hypothetical protein CMH27_02870 [Micavibrio sp.]|mgnify:CR=1 FL=1|nr:hypothetical protein [Micavibrio sp.]|tara:strand:- start:6953 stop:7384 length:432 start_codon:yes stop_codon:yes gene_type:complete
MKAILKYTLGLLLLIPASQAFAEASVVYNDSNYPIALIGLDKAPEDGDMCSTHFGKFMVDDIAYEGVSEMIGGIRVKQINKDMSVDKQVKLIRLDTSDLSNAASGWLPTFFNKGKPLLIAYNVCGNGGFHYARDIYDPENLNW